MPCLAEVIEELLSFGARLIRDHGKALEELPGLAGTQGVDLPTAFPRRPLPTAWAPWTTAELASSRRSLASPFQHLRGSVSTPMKSAVGECLLDDVMLTKMRSERVRDLGYSEVTT